MYKNEYPVTWKLYKEWITDSKFRGRRLVFTIIWCLFTIASIVASFFDSFWPFYLILILFGIYRAFFHDYVIGKSTYKRLAEVRGCEDWVRTITISDEEIEIIDGNSNTKYQTANIVNITEKGDMVRLDISATAAIRLYKSAFIEGDWENCRLIFDRN